MFKKDNIPLFKNLQVVFVSHIKFMIRFQTKKPFETMQTVDTTSRSVDQCAIQIACGNYDDSIKSLAASLSVIKEALNEGVWGKEAIHGPSQQNGYVGVEFLKLKTPFLLNCKRQVNHRRMPIFRQPVVAQWNSSVEGHRLGCLSFVALYNLALCYHLQYEDNDDTTNGQNLHKAQYLYEYAYDILKSQEIEISELHLMALANNLAAVHRALGDEEKTRLCLQQLLSLLMYAIDYGHTDQLEDSLDGFVETVLPLMISETETAPAA
jgi:tetratricopeptide (TPR) repeat protein